MNMSLFLSELIAKPIKLHVHSFGSVLYNFGSDDTVGETVVKLHWFWILDVTHFMQGIEKGYGIFPLMKPEPVSDS